MKAKHKKIRDFYERIAIVLQGGGALGAYQVGAYEILHEHDYEPDLVVGTSIGAINSAIIVGNPPDERIDKLHEFWNSISTPDVFGFDYLLGNDYLKEAYNFWGAQMALFFGQSNFFAPRLLNPWFAIDESVNDISFYDTAPLKETLMNLVDFERINFSETVLKIGAVELKTGRIKYFNNISNEITAEHIMASCALPPGFSSVEINGDAYWDGGVHSNTPLHMVLDAHPRRETLCFMLDLFSSIGNSPTKMEEVLERKKDITFASQTRRPSRLYSGTQNLRHAIARLGEKLPEELKQDKEIQQLLSLGSPNRIDIVHIIYDTPSDHHSTKDYNFLQSSIDAHMECGRQDTQKLFVDADWFSWTEQENKGVTIYTAPTNPQQEEDVL